MTDVDWWYLMMVNDITSGQAILTEDNDETHGWKGQFLHVTTALTLTGAPWMWHHPRLLPRAKAAGCGGKITGSSHYIQRLAIIGEKKHGFSEVLAGFRGLITKFREEFEFGFPRVLNCQELRSLVSTLVIVRWVKFTTSFGMSWKRPCPM